MNKKKKLKWAVLFIWQQRMVVLLVWLLLWTWTMTAGERKVIMLNDDWQFRLSTQTDGNKTRRVDLPHTWNTQDALSGDANYHRGIGNYTKKLFVPTSWKGKRLWLRFEGANSVAHLFVNGQLVTVHKGGYEAWVADISERVDYGKENTLLVRVNNAENLDVMPLVGDFNFYGGLYRGVSLLLLDAVHIAPDVYASPGVYVTTNTVTDKQANVDVQVLVNNAESSAQTPRLKVEILNGEKVVAQSENSIEIAGNEHGKRVTVPLEVANPHLWNGVNDPFLYTVRVTLSGARGNDEVCQPLGIRTYSVDPERGFLLNGKPYRLHGVNRHQDRAEVGNALQPWHHEEDAALMKEMGVNCVRLAHYPQATYFYDLMDKLGIVVWAEIPFVGPGGYGDKGFVDTEAFKENGKQQLKELIRQHYNHPSICFWGLFNELKYYGDNPVSYIKELQKLAHEEDSTRLTTSASNVWEGDMNLITDVQAFNRYDGWYGSTPKTLASFLDKWHREHPDRPPGISEYGAGASVYHQQDSLKQPAPGSWWHPENWQTYYHMENWRIMAARPWIWGTFVWNMFDFGAAHRTEGDRPGINDKGLVTFDRKVRKDAFYFYKANWNKAPMVYLADKRALHNKKGKTDLLVFSNCGEVTLWMNGKKVATAKPDSICCCTFTVDIPGKGTSLEVKARNGREMLTDGIMLE